MEKPKQSPRRRWNVKPWPHPGDSLEDKAKRIAISYRQLVFDITQGHCHDPAGDLHRLDQHWATHGAYWPNPPNDTPNPDEWHTAADLAHLIHRTPADIYRWARRDKIRQRTGPDGAPQYHLPSAVDYQRDQRQRRQNRNTMHDTKTEINGSR